MEGLMTFLPVVLYILGIVLLVILIILGIKLIETLDRANLILADFDRKSKSLNRLFNMIDNVTDTIEYLSDTLVGGIVSSISRVFPKRKKRKKESEENE